MELLSSIFFQAFYAMLEELISVVNVFATIQEYAIIKKQTKKNKKSVL